MSLDGKRAVYLRLARYITDTRRLRDEILGADEFADPAWDMLLHLYIAMLEGQERSVGDTCAGGRVPLTTGMRWINELADRELVEKVFDRNDRRRIFVRLTTAHLQLMDQFFEQLAGMGEELFAPSGVRDQGASDPGKLR